MKGYSYFTMFYNDRSDEPSSWEWGHKVLSICRENDIPYTTTYPDDDVPECTIWVKDGFKRKLNALLKK